MNAKKNDRTSKMTIDKLAVMVAKGFDTLSKDISDVKKDVNNIKKDVSSNNKVSNLMLKEISAIHEDNKRFRETVASLNMDGISYDRRLENLTIRVEKLEIKKVS